MSNTQVYIDNLQELGFTYDAISLVANGVVPIPSDPLCLQTVADLAVDVFHASCQWYMRPYDDDDDEDDPTSAMSPIFREETLLEFLLHTRHSIARIERMPRMTLGLQILFEQLNAFTMTYD